MNRLICISLLLVGGSISAQTIIGPWVPRFKGIDFSVSTNLPPAGSLPNLQVVSAFRVDLTDPDVRLFVTPRRSDYIEGIREVGGYTVSDFLELHDLQVAINANFFDARRYYLTPNYPMDLYGLAISEGVVVSPQDDREHAAALLFDTNNAPTILYTNWPAADTTGVFTAVAGNYPLLVNGTNIARRTGNLEREPRTAFGVSKDRRYLYLVGIDGRQDDYSEGAFDWETGEWLLMLGAHDGLNLDGGGSTTLVMESSTGQPLRLNHPNSVADSGEERTVGGHFGVFANPLPSFNRDLTVAVTDTSATISWQTDEPTRSRIEYGMTEGLGLVSVEETGSLAVHSIELSELHPGTKYFYRVISSTENGVSVSPIYAFTTTIYVLFDFTQAWKYSNGMEGSDWTLPSFDDSGWAGPSPGLLWVDVRASGPNEEVEPRSTEMEADPSTGYPYIAYYFRTEFGVTNLIEGSSLGLTALVDDGLVVYLNGEEIWRLRIPEGATSETLSSAYGCGGDATCEERFIVPPVALSSLKIGTNTLAVEVHNYDARSPDLTFGLSANLIQPSVKAPELNIEASGTSITLAWRPADARLQSASSLDGQWNDEAGESPLVFPAEDSNRFFRLVR